MNDYQIKLLMLVHELETSLGDLYTIFKERFPEYNNLWETLIKEEREHAEAVRRLYRMTYDGQVLFDEGSIKSEGVQSIIDYLQNIHGASQRGVYTAKQAVTIAYNIEKSLIEKDIFKHFKVAPQFADLLHALLEGANNHLQLIKREFDKLH
jgi:hypothetical protein